MSAGADISVSDRGQMLVASLAGEVDMTNAAYVREELSTAVPNEAHGLVLDLTDARYLDSAGIEVLFELSRRLVRRAPAVAAGGTPAVAATAAVHADRPGQRGACARFARDGRRGLTLTD